MLSEGPSLELRQKGVAAETIKAVLIPWANEMSESIIARLAKATPVIDEFLSIQVDARMLYKLKKEIDFAINNGSNE